MSEAKFGGDPIDNFKKGWALACFTWGKAHYFKVANTSKFHQIGDDGEVKMVKSLCGHKAFFDDKRPMMDVGDFG